MATITETADITDSDHADVENPQLRAIALRVARQAELSVEKVAANAGRPDRFPLAADPDSIERILAERFAALSPRQQQAATAAAGERLAAPRDVRARRYGDLLGVDLASTVPVEEQAATLPIPRELQFSSDALGPRTDGHSGGGPASFSPMTRLELRVLRVTCVDETDGFLGTEAGSDEIALGGATVDPAGATAKISAFDVGSDFDDGDTVVFTPPHGFATFSLGGAGSFPKSCFVTFALAEVDFGGIGDFLNKLLPKVKKAVTDAVNKAIKDHVSNSDLASILGMIVTFVVEQLFNYLSSVWSDDIFPPRTVSTTISALDSRFPGGATDSPDKTVTFVGHGGIYKLVYDWHLLP